MEKKEYPENYRPACKIDQWRYSANVFIGEDAEVNEDVRKILFLIDSVERGVPDTIEEKEIITEIENRLAKLFNNLENK